MIWPLPSIVHAHASFFILHFLLPTPAQKCYPPLPLSSCACGRGGARLPASSSLDGAPVTSLPLNRTRPTFTTSSSFFTLHSSLFIIRLFLLALAACFPGKLLACRAAR